MRNEKQIDLETFDRVAKFEKIDRSLTRGTGERKRNETKEIEKKGKSGRKDETRDEIAGAK